MSSVAARVFRGCRTLLAPASRAAATSSLLSSSRSLTTVTAGGTKKSAAKPKPKSKPDSPAKKKTPRTTGIFKATPVSPALAQFLGTGETTRTDAVKEVWTYVKSHDLQNPADKREIFCDEKLKQIFEGKDKVGFLEVTKLLSTHFVKTA
ncbi:SWIB/MDM2 domain superfamily protein [Raphanus sativus]|uniref:Protein TRI1-like n=1 Tax=Raphanus sativus TaxID=3726 RepID=A0A9W3BT37_RAPSA|nr:protein TRI1-like [Raphanus sativus]KAJ4892808.1 SWIB/MDM2 domain superfamily protein [Raphanus sativus]